MDASETDDASLIGEVCHIVAESENGPRGAFPLDLVQRNTYGNLVLLCNVHHKLIDDQPNTYPVEELHKIKSQHEAFVRSRLKVNDLTSQRSKEIIASYIDAWDLSCDIEFWNAWTSHLLGGRPVILAERFEALQNVQTWLLSRTWPKGGFTALQRAFENFRRVLGGFLEVFDRHSIRMGIGQQNDRYMVEEFYRIPEYNEARYFKLLREFTSEVNLIEDHVYELTRAANLVCDAVRAELLPFFRLEQGALLVTTGFDMNFKTHTYRPEYKGDDSPALYQGVEDFNRRRLTRDIHMGNESEATFLEVLAKERRPPWEADLSEF